MRGNGMKLLRRLLRPAVYLVVALAVIAIGALAVLTMTEGGRTRLAGMISSAASNADRTVRISGIDGVLSGDLTIRQVVVSDAAGTWLVARGGRLDWSPFALLAGRFDARLVHFDRIEIARLPSGSSTDAAGNDPLSLPVDISVDEISLPDVALGAEIAGDVASLSAEGRMSAAGSPPTMEGELRVSRTDGREGSLSAVLAFVPQDNRIDIRLEGSEPPGGVIANLLKIQGAPGVDIEFNGRGPASDWAGDGTLSLDGEVVTRLSARHRQTDQGSRITASGEGAFDAFVPVGLRALVAGNTVFELDGTLGSGGIAVERATLRSASLEAEARGSTDSGGVTDIVLSARARGEAVPLRVEAGAESVVVDLRQFDLRAFGEGARPSINGSIKAARIVSGAAVVETAELSVRSDEFDIAGMSGPVGIGFSAGAIGVENETLARLLAGGLAGEAELTVEATTATVRSGRASTGTLEATFEGTAARDGSAMDIGLAAVVASGVLPAAARGPLGEKVEVSGRISRSPSEGIRLTGMTLTSGDLTAEANARIGGETLDARISGRLGELSRLAAGASGAVEFVVEANGETFRPDLSATVRSERIETGGRAIEALELTARGRADLDNPSAEVGLSGRVAGEALKGSATLRNVDGRNEIDDLLVTLGGNRIAGALVLDASFVPAGAVDFDVPDIGALAALALEEIEGKASGSLRFGRQDGNPNLDIEASIPSFRRGELSGTDVRISGNVSNYLEAPLVSGRIAATRIDSGTTRIDGVSVALERDGEWTGFDGTLQVNEIPVTAAGRAKVSGGDVTVELSQAGGTLQGLRAALARPTVILVRNGVTRLDALTVSVAGGSAEITGTLAETVNLGVRIGSLPASAINAFAAGLGAEGTVSGTVRVTGAASNPSVEYAIDWRGGSTVQTREAGFGAMTVAANGTYAGQRVRITARAGDGSGLGLQGGGTIDLAGARAIALDFDGTVPFSFLTRRLAAQGLALEGASNVRIGARGSLSSPQVTGSITTANARFIAARQGIAINEIGAEISLGGGRATISRFNGTLSTGGRLTVAGTVGIDAGGGFPADLQITIADGRYTDGQVVTTTFNGELKVTGSLTGTPLLAGIVNLGRTVITVPERLPASLANLDVQHRNAPAGVNAQDRAVRPDGGSGGGGAGMNLDVTVNAPQQIFVQGRGLDVELGGNLRLTGPMASPQAVGQFSLRRGRLGILGRRLDFTRGNIGFSGSLVPYIDLSADTAVSDGTVTIQVIGPATNPAFRFSSSPALPEDEVLARLVFGRSMSNLSPLQIAQLAAAAAQLAGVGGSTSLLDTLRNKTGVDDIDVKTDEETGDTSVAVGKYLNDRTYVTIEKGSGEGSGKATINLDIGRGLKLRGEATDGGETKGGIYFERDY